MGTVVVPLDEGWARLYDQGILVLENFLETGKATERAAEGRKEVQGRKQQLPDAKRRFRIFTVKEYSDMYTTVYNMCTQRAPHNWSERLYCRYGETISKYVTEQIMPALLHLEDVPLLEELLKRWQNHKIYVKWMDRFFTYLDRYYVKLQTVETLHLRGINIFNELVFKDVKDRVTRAVLDNINRERAGEKIDQDLMRGIRDMYLGLGGPGAAVYSREFETAYLSASAEYFCRMCSGWISEDSFPEYLRKVEETLQHEEDRVNRYLHRPTWEKLKKEIITALIANPEKALLEKETGVSFLLSNDKREDLTRMHQLFTLVSNGEGLHPVAALFREHVKARGCALVEEKAQQLKAAFRPDLSDPSFVQSLLDLHDMFKSVVNECFAADSLFQKALKEAFENFVNQEVDKYSFAQLMASFCDRILKKSGEKLSDEQVEAGLMKIVELFSYLTDKDLFADIYRNQLAKRLLHETSASEDSEKSMIARLKLKCGTQFTSKLEGMINDLAVAADTQREFSEFCESAADAQEMLGGVHVQVQVLTTGYWPTYQTHDINLASELQKAMSLFTTFYGKKTQHRRLTWIHSLGQVVVAGQFSKKHDLICNTCQACILLLFQSDDALSIDSIIRTLKIDEAYCKKLLATLSLNKFKILVKENSEGSERTISSGDFFRANDNFQCPHRKLKIAQPSQEETHNRERVEEDRSIAIDAAIVRIMKARKSLPHHQLISEVLQQLSFFRPNPKAVKQRIEQLIEREYLERQVEQASVYRYLA